MENLEIKNTALYRTIECTIKDMLKQNIDDVLDSVMPLFEPFIRERLNQYEEYRKLQVAATAPITVVNNEALDKFKTLQHITGDMEITFDDWGYAPNLYQFDRSWHVDWIHCKEGNSIIKGFTAQTPEEAIDKAYNWFHSTFCNG
jgi:hypothetical protein